MKITLTIDDDILVAARELAHREQKTMGYVVSDLARRGLSTYTSGVACHLPALYPFRPLAGRGGCITNEMIDRLRDGDSY